MGRTREVSKILSSDTLLATDAELASVQSSLGLIHINTSTFSAATTHSVDNVFSATYDNYELVFNNLSCSTAADLRFRFRDGSGELSTNVYDFFLMTNETPTRSLNNNHFIVANMGGNIIARSTVRILGPFNTGYNSAAIAHMIIDSTSNLGLRSFYQQLTNTNSYTGFSIFGSAGNITGSVSVFGYRK